MRRDEITVVSGERNVLQQVSQESNKQGVEKNGSRQPTGDGSGKKMIGTHPSLTHCTLTPGLFPNRGNLQGDRRAVVHRRIVQ